jgi:hypothetical protein
MINFLYSKDGVETKVSVPSNWSEVTFDKYVELVNGDEGKIENVISILSGVPLLDIINISADEFIVLSKVCFFVFDRTEIINHVQTPDGFEEWNIGDESWSKLEQAKTAINLCSPQPITGMVKDENDVEVLTVIDHTPAKDSINSAKEIVKIYTGKDIGQLPVLEAIGQANFFLCKCLTFLTDSND